MAAHAWNHWCFPALIGVMGLVAGCGGREPPAVDAQAGGAAGAAAAAASPIDTAQGGRTAWVRRLGGRGMEQVWAVASGAGGAAVLTLIGDQGPMGTPPYDLGLVRLRGDGSIAWSRQFHGTTDQVTWGSVAVSGMGNVFLSVHVDCTVGSNCMDFGAGQASGSLLLKFDPQGRLVWQRVIEATEGRSDLTVDGSGGVALAVYRSSGGASGKRLVRYGWDGTRIYDIPAPALGGLGDLYPLVLGLAPAGDLAVGDGSVLYLLDPSGRLRWRASLAPGRVTGVGATEKGTVVALVHLSGGTLTWAGTSATAPAGTSGTFLAVAEASGAPRFGRVVGLDRWPLGAAVDPVGRVAVLTGSPGGCSRLERWNLAGDRLWARAVTGCNPAVQVRAVSADPVSHHVDVGGAFPGTIDLGAGPVTSNGDYDAFVLDVEP